MSRIRIIIAISACYFLFAILLNSVGTVILQAINSMDVSKTEASSLEGFKDLSIAFASFFIASLIPRLGYKIALFIALIAVTIGSLNSAFMASFGSIQLLFALIGVSFALVKVAVYAIIGQLTDTAEQHSSLLNTVEGIFMLGSLSGYWLFSLFVDPNDTSSLEWLNVYYILALLAVVALLFVSFSPISKPATETKQSPSQAFFDMLKLSLDKLILIFIISIFLYVLIEQGIGTWLPTFNNQVLGLPTDVSVQLTSIFAGALAVGRLLAGVVLRYVSWFVFLTVCLAAMSLLILLTVPLSADYSVQSIKSVFDVPFVAFLLPLIGLFMAPIYPLLNSVMLSSLAKHQHAAMTGLIVVFSALGGTTGSIITGFTFDKFGGQTAFYLSIVPIVLLFLSVSLFYKKTRLPSAVEA